MDDITYINNLLNMKKYKKNISDCETKRHHSNKVPSLSNAPQSADGSDLLISCSVIHANT